MPANDLGSAVAPVDVDKVLSRDDAQEAKEAICDAVIERMRRVVSGEGGFGAFIYGRRPSRAMTSGFLISRHDDQGLDESSDISIPLHGLDCRMAAEAEGEVRLRPTFSVYLRVMPSSADVFDPRLSLRPAPEFNAAANGQIRAAVSQVTSSPEYKAKPYKEKQSARLEAMRGAWRNLGVEGVAKAKERLDDDGDVDVALFEDGAEIRIPDVHSVQHDIPLKFVRIPVQPPELVLPLPYDRQVWANAIGLYDNVLRTAVDDACSNWIDTPEGQLSSWRSVRVPGSAFWSPDRWDGFLQVVRQTPPNKDILTPRMVFRTIADGMPDLFNPGILTLRLAIENFQQGRNEADDGIFQVKLDALFPKGSLVWMTMERVRRSYQFAGFLSVPSVGVNGGVTHSETDTDEVLTTTWMPRFVLPRMRPTAFDNVPVVFATLQNDKLDVADLLSLPNEMDNWIGSVQSNTALFEPGEEGSAEDEARQQANFQRDLAAWQEELKRVRKGVELLRRSQQAYLADKVSTAAIPYIAWLLMNETFRLATPNPGWRLFQLGFILTHIPTLASRVPGFEDCFEQAFDEDSASLLYMATGGGKSEAFFGVLIYSLFLDRLRGKKRGITAMMHYPLRLLTLQQAQRLMRLLAKAEIIRFDRKLGGAPFEIGFWVGSNNTPNQTMSSATALRPEMAPIPTEQDDPRGAREDKLRKESDAYVQCNDSWNKLPKCPFCGHEQTGLRMFRRRHGRLGIVCLGNNCDWNKRNDGPGKERAPLPFLIVDTDIYRHAPSVLLGTIDKLALIGNQPTTINRIAGMFGLARFIQGNDETGMLITPHRADDINALSADGSVHKVAPAWHNGSEVFFDPIPSLIIQDELHLLEELLGTFGGIFETTLFAWFAEIGRLMGQRVIMTPGIPDQPRMPHVIGATATAADAARQTEHLYQRKVVQFPHPGPKLYRSFYSQLAEFEDGDAAAERNGKVAVREQEANAPWARLYASMLTNGRTHTTATIEILSAYAVGITRWTRDLCDPDPTIRATAVQEIRDNLSDGPLSARHRAVIDRIANAGRHDVLAKLVDLHRIMLTYVTNKKGGDQLMSALEREIYKSHRLEGGRYEIDGFDLELISGGVDIRGIQDVIKKAEKEFHLGSNDITEMLRCIVATSAISHGVDVSTFNAMLFAGMPSDIAEYIQASSRVGRTHVGFSLLVPTPQNRRDKFVLENHAMFHRFLERMIQPPAIERWADKAILRTVPSMFQTFFAGVRYQKQFVAAADQAKTGVAFPDDVNGVANVFSGARRDQAINDCLDFMGRSIGLNAAYGGAQMPGHYRLVLKQRLGAIVDDLLSGRYGGRLTEFWASDEHGHPRPMTSLRDVDEAGMIVADTSPPRGGRNTPTPKSVIRDAMNFIRNRRISGRQSRAMAGELDTDGGGTENGQNGLARGGRRWRWWWQATGDGALARAAGHGLRTWSAVHLGGRPRGLHRQGRAR